MKISVAGYQYAFFAQYGFILFEALFTPEIADLWLVAESVLSDRKKSGQPSYPIKDETLFYGRDLALTSPDFQKKLFSSRLPQVAAQILKKRALRYAFDQLWRAPECPCGDGALGENFCVSPLSLVAIVPFTSNTETHEKSSSPTPFQLSFDDLPSKQGDVLFVRPDVLWKVRFLPEARGRTFLFVGFGVEQIAYINQPRDTHLHSLKRFGYIVGESLRESTHPFVVR